mmetsp:Transcript_36740/g.109139  ORF Transcript_36740/g.109139 Transcript_36740/m.109139 type:complete len:319 (+) Transcript_36740:1185-2141(+)
MDLCITSRIFMGSPISSETRTPLLRFFRYCCSSLTPPCLPLRRSALRGRFFVMVFESTLTTRSFVSVRTTSRGATSFPCSLWHSSSRSSILCRSFLISPLAPARSSSSLSLSARSSAISPSSRVTTAWSTPPLALATGVGGSEGFFLGIMEARRPCRRSSVVMESLVLTSFFTGGGGNPCAAAAAAALAFSASSRASLSSCCSLASCFLSFSSSSSLFPGGCPCRLGTLSSVFSASSVWMPWVLTEILLLTGSSTSGGGARLGASASGASPTAVLGLRCPAFWAAKSASASARAFRAFSSCSRSAFVSPSRCLILLYS